MNRKILILHLSDIHIKDDNDLILRESESIAKTVYCYLPNIFHILVVISGDIAFSGTKNQYKLAVDFLGNIINKIENEKDIPINVILTPGNHDLDFSDTASVEVRKIMLDHIRTNPDKLRDEHIQKIVLEPQKHYIEFQNIVNETYNKNLYGTEYSDSLYQKYIIPIADKNIKIQSINVACCSERREKIGELSFPVDNYKEYIQHSSVENIDFCISMLHQPLHWQQYDSYRELRNILKEHSDLILTGHEHINNSGNLHDTESGNSSVFFIEAGTLQERSNDISNSTFNIIELDIETSLIIHKLQLNCVNSSAVIYKEVEKKQEYCLKNREKHHQKLTITKNFMGILNDLGTYIRHHLREKVNLSDIFVYPQLKKTSVSSDEYISAREINYIDEHDPYIFILGDEKYGKTSLLYTLYQKYFDDGYIPLYIDGSELANVKNIDVFIEKQVINQYGSHNIEEYNQTSKKKKILFIDDIDLSNSNQRQAILSDVKERFSYIILTANALFDTERIIENTTSPFVDFSYYKLRSFGYVLRDELIKKWFSLGIFDTNTSITDDEFFEKCINAKNKIDSIIGAGIMPPIPLFIIILLQTIESSQVSTLEGNSSLSHYYHAIITIALENKIHLKEEIEEFFSYLTELAWYLHTLKSNKAFEKELEEFNASFSRKWHTVDFPKRLRILVDADILEKNFANEYAFKYPYIYYYFKGKYLNERRDDRDIQSVIPPKKPLTHK